MPGMLSAFGVFVMRQFIANIPDELLDAGRIDGLSEFGLVLADLYAPFAPGGSGRGDLHVSGPVERFPVAADCRKLE